MTETSNRRELNSYMVVCWALRISAIAGALLCASCNEAPEVHVAQSTASTGPASEVGRSGNPRSAQPFADRFESLMVSAKAGDKVAADQVFSEWRTCTKVIRAKSFIDRISADKASWANSDAQVSKLSEADLAAIEAQTKLIKDNEDLCRGAESLKGDSVGFDSTLQAAEHGNTDAAICYVWTAYDLPEARVNNPAALDVWQKNARRFIEAGLKSGDWRAVTLAQQANNNAPGWAGLIYRQDPVALYEYTKLKRLGSDEKTAAELDKQLDIFRKNLKPNEVLAADDRALNTFNRYFSKKQRYVDNQVLCDI